MNNTLWTVKWKKRGDPLAVSCYSKKTAIHHYLDLLDTPFHHSISELRIYKNEVDYTATLNRFLIK